MEIDNGKIPDNFIGKHGDQAYDIFGSFVK